MSRQKSWCAIRKSVHSPGRNHLVQRYTEKKNGPVLKLVFVEQMICLPLYGTVGEEYKKYYYLPLEKDNTTFSLCLLLRKTDATTCG